MSTESAFDKTRGMRSRKGSSKSDRVAATPKNVQASPSKDVVGDRILNSYPDRNPLETGFPIHHSRFSTPELDNFYNVVRKRIVVAVHEEGFRRGAFKPDISSGHGSVQHVVLQMQLSGEISKEQFKILVTFGRKWCAAIGDSFDRKAYPILDNDFIAESGVETATEDLFAMLDEEFKNPNPYPLPDDIKYKDSATLLKIAANADEKKKAEEEAAGSVAVAAFSDNDVSSSKNDASGPSFTTIFLRDGISKPRLLAKLKEYDAANSKDAVLRRAWEEISKHKGELTAASIDGLTEPTAKLIWDQIQSESAGKSYSLQVLLKLTLSTALNAPIPMGASLNATIAKLETMQLNTSPSSSKAALNLYAPPKESMTSKMKKFVKGKGKGKENQ